MIRTAAAMAWLEGSVIELYMCPRPMRKGHGPACLASALGAPAWRGSSPWGVHPV